MTNVVFYRGLRANYNATTHADGLYFATDTNEIMLNGLPYGGKDLGLAENKVVKSIEQNVDDPTQLDIVYTDTTTGTITLPASTYTSSIEDKTLPTPSAVGGIAKGTKVEDLEGKTQSEMWDELLFPTVVPTFTAPTASLSFTGYSAIVEAGATGPVLANFNEGYNPGAITLNGVKQANRGGAQDVANSFIYIGGVDTNRDLPLAVALGDTRFNYRAAYAEGPQPVDNKGNDYSTPLAAGTVNSGNLNLNGTYPFYATTSGTTVEGTQLVKQPLIAWKAAAGTMSSANFIVRPHGDTPQTIRTPRAITEIRQLNEDKGTMDIVSIGAWTVSDEVVNINGTDVTYKKYVYNGATRGATQLSIKF